MRRAVIALGLLLLATAAARTQQQQPNPAFRAGVELVTVDVIVVDKAGVPIRGLTADDFAVTFDGKSRPVRAIDFLQYAEPPGVDETAPPVAGGATKPAPTATADRGGRVFLIVFDDLSAKLTQIKSLALAAERMLATFDDDDLVALMTTSGLGPVVQPTRDRDVILKALKSKLLVGRNDDNPSPRFYIGVNEAIEIFNGALGTLVQVIERECGIRNYSPARATDSDCPNKVEMDARHLGALTIHRTASQIATYRAAIAAMGQAPKPRIVIALSYGVALSPTDNIREQTESIARAAAEAGTQFYAIIESVEEFDMNRRPGMELALRGEKAFLNSGAQVVANAAGGEWFLAVGQADRFFTRIQRETSGFYRLGVEAPLGTDRRRLLDAKVTVRGSGMTVRTNSHAILETAAAEVTSPDERARTALAQGGASYGVPIALATALRRNPANADLQLGVSVQVPSAVPGPLVAMFAIIDEAGQIARNGRAPMTASGVSNDYYLNLPVPITSGRYKLRVVVADANGNVGGVEQPVAASLAQLGHFMASDLFTGWAADDGVTRFLALEALPERATTLQASLELYADGPAAASDLTVRFEIVPSGQTNAIFRRDVVPNRNGGTLTASVALPTDELPSGVFDIVATVFEGNAETGTVTKRVRKGGG